MATAALTLRRGDCGFGLRSVQQVVAVEETDEILLGRYVQGDASAFELLLERYERKVFSHAYRMTSRAVVAEEITQEAFLKLARDAHYFDGRASFRTWFYRIVRNLCIDVWRRGRNRHEKEFDDTIQPGGLAETTLTRTESSSDLAVHHQQAELVEEALSQIPTEQKEVVLMRIRDDLKFEEIAKIVGVSTNTVKSRMRYALSNLRKIIGEAVRLEEEQEYDVKTS